MQAFQANVFHDCAGDSISGERLNAGGTVCNDADGAGVGDGRHGGVSSTEASGLNKAALISRKGLLLVRQFFRRGVRMGWNEAHQRRARF
jgi:hypothetical protein